MCTIVKTKIHAARTPIDGMKLLTCLSDDGSVNNRGKLLKVIDKDAVKKNCVTIHEKREKLEFVEVGALTCVCFHDTVDLLLQAVTARRDKSTDKQALAFVEREAGTAVESGIMDN